MVKETQGEAKRDLSRQQKVALDSRWWTRRGPKVRAIEAACRAAHIDHWTSTFEEQFSQNKKLESVRPNSWAQLAASINKHDKDLRKRKRLPKNRAMGEGPSNELALEHIQACAVALGIEGKDAVPLNAHYLAHAARWLVRIVRGITPFSQEEATAYGEYLCEASGREHVVRLHADLLRVVLGRLKTESPAQVEDEILKVANSVGGVLLTDLDNFPIAGTE